MQRVKLDIGMRNNHRLWRRMTGQELHFAKICLDPVLAGKHRRRKMGGRVRILL